jgi:hypothetical protein
MFQTSLAMYAKIMRKYHDQRIDTLGINYSNYHSEDIKRTKMDNIFQFVLNGIKVIVFI